MLHSHISDTDDANPIQSKSLVQLKDQRSKGKGRGRLTEVDRLGTTRTVGHDWNESEGRMREMNREERKNEDRVDELIGLSYGRIDDMQIGRDSID